MPTQKLAWKSAATSRDFLCERLQSAFTLANQLCWITKYHWNLKVGLQSWKRWAVSDWEGGTCRSLWLGKRMLNVKQTYFLVWIWAPRCEAMLICSSPMKSRNSCSWSNVLFSHTRWPCAWHQRYGPQGIKWKCLQPRSDLDFSQACTYLEKWNPSVYLPGEMESKHVPTRRNGIQVCTCQEEWKITDPRLYLLVWHCTPQGEQGSKVVLTGRKGVQGCTHQSKVLYSPGDAGP